MAETIFSKILRGELPCHRVYEDDQVLAFLDIFPLSRGHTLVIPKEPAVTLDQLSDDAAAALGRVLPRIARAVLAASGATAYNLLQVSALMDGSHVSAAAREILARLGADVPVFTAEDAVLTQLTGFHLTRGMLCAMRRPALPEAGALCRAARRVVVLENVMNPTNLGAIFRSAAALNMDAVLLTEAGSDPLYRRAVRVSMGTVFQIPWTYLPDGWPEPSMGWLRAQGFRTVAMALRDDSVPLNDPRLLAEERLAIVLGTERDGLAHSTIARCDYTVMIPMQHGVDSLNVAAAGAVAFWELRKR